MEGNFPSNPLNIEEEGRDKVDYSLAINEVNGIMGIDWFLQSDSGQGVFPDEPQMKARDTCTTVDEEHWC